MYYKFLLFALLALITICQCQPAKNQESAQDSLPNIIYILADDLGYGELGCYGQELIETPNLDALAQGGMRFSQHYSGAPVCAPARCILLTGKHAGHAHIRGNDEWRARGEVWDFGAMFRDSTLEGQRPIPDEEITIAELLQRKNYRTGIVGKWGLGAPHTEGVPNNQGFDFFYGYNCQRQAHTFYPLHLWKNREKVLLRNKMVPPRQKLPEDADPNDSASYSDFRLTDYSAALMQDEVLQFIDRNKENPFFLYYATPIPHVPLQAPKKWVDYYRQKFGPEEPYIGDKGYFPSQFPHAEYAAMISYLDAQVGEIVEKLKMENIFDNTLIIFSSDNGPTYVGGADTEYFDSAKPFRTDYGRAKGFTHEGGIRVPMIAHWPAVISAGTTSDHISIFYDVMPTLCEIAGVAVPPDRDGISFLPALKGMPQQHTHQYLYWEFPAYKGQQAVRLGDWKGIRKNIFEGNMDIELFDLKNDLREEQDVADQHPEIVQRIQQIMQEAHKPAAIERFKMTQLGD